MWGVSLPFHKYETAIFCKVFNVNRLAEGKPVFSQTISDFSQTEGKFFIKKVFRKCRKSAVFRIFAGVWRFYTYKTATLVKHSRQTFSLQNPSE